MIEVQKEGALYTSNSTTAWAIERDSELYPNPNKAVDQVSHYCEH